MKHVVIVDSNTKKLIPKEEKKNPVFIIHSGEKHKNMDTVNKIITFLLKNNFGIETVLIAVGGGVVGDITGFVASIYKRGIKYIQVPTTLLAMVDSSIGGKTGVNHALGKNMIGTFYKPEKTIINIELLKTLPEREYLSGMAEVVKYSIIDEPFSIWLNQNIKLVIKRKELDICIKECRCIKKMIVRKDLNDTHVRHILNYGHTFGHALEAVCGYGKLLHGEAVNHGMRAANYLSYSFGIIEKKELERRNVLCQLLTPPKLPKNISFDKLIGCIKNDKKSGFVLIDNRFNIVHKNIDKKKLLEVWENVLNDHHS
jgi:3-dehydroquinate synthase